jgi:uncharacterized glyoxalase superfamily protein PhnB
MGGALRKVALLGCLILQVRSDVAPKVRHLAAAAAVSVLETPVLGILVMMAPTMKALALEEMKQHGVVLELEAQKAATEAFEAMKASASVGLVSLATATSFGGRAEELAV